MAEQRLIDSNADVYPYVETWTCNCSECGVQNVMAVDDISTLPEIDPETLPIVCKLREREKDLEWQLSDWKFWWGPVREHEAEELREKRAAVNVMRKRCEKTIAELRAELRRVTAERDAAQRLLAEHTGVVGMEKVTTCFGCPLDKVLELVMAYRDGRIIMRQESE